MSGIVVLSRRAVVAAGAASVVAASLLAPTAASAAAGKPTVTITAASRTTTYGGAEPALGYTVSGLGKGDKLTRKPVCSVPAHHAAGRYPITCSRAVAPKKYAIRYVGATLTVGRAALYLKPNFQQKYYGDAEPAFTYSTRGLVGSDRLLRTPTCSIDGAHTAVGRYTITCTGTDAGSNYTLYTGVDYLLVAKRNLLVGPNRQAIYFGSPEPDFTYSAYNLAPGEQLAKAPTCAVAGEHVHIGRYTIACDGAEASSNYAMTVVSSPFDVAMNETVVIGDKAAISKNVLGQPTAASLRAQLYLVHPYGHVFADQKLTFTSGSTTLCAGVQTDQNGYATCTITAGVAELVKNGHYTVTYADQQPAGKAVDIRGDSRTVEND